MDHEREIAFLQKKGKLFADLISRVAPPLIGALVAGPVGAIAGGSVGALLKHGLEEFAERWLTPKEVKRVGTAASYIIGEMEQNLTNGAEINSQLFKETGEISDAEELFEGVLIKCKNEYQEKKVRLISNVFVNAAFDSTISGETASQILNTAERLTYRQLCIISFVGRLDSEFDRNSLLKDPYVHYPNKEPVQDLELLKQDIHELINLGLLKNGDIMMSSNDDIKPSLLSLSLIGNKTSEVLKLSSIDIDELTPIYQSLKYRKELGLNQWGKIDGQQLTDS